MDDIMAPATDEQLQAKVDALPNPAPRLTPELIQAVIKDEIYTRLPDSNTTVCQLTLQNGYKVLGVNMGSVDPANYNEEIGCEYAYKDAVSKIWQLEGYLLAERLHVEAEDGENTKSAAVQVFHVLRQVQDVIRGHRDGAMPAGSVARLVSLLEQPLADWEPLAAVPEGFTHVANPVHVKARRIETTVAHDDGSMTVYWQPPTPDQTYCYECDATMLARYRPVDGDYLVEQEDGYTYLNPKDVFERKYRAVAPA